MTPPPKFGSDKKGPHIQILGQVLVQGSRPSLILQKLDHSRKYLWINDSYLLKNTIRTKKIIVHIKIILEILKRQMKKYDGPSVKEKIFEYIFSPPYFVGRKYI